MTTYAKGKPHRDGSGNVVLNSYSYFFSLIIPHGNWYYHYRNVILIFGMLLADIFARSVAFPAFFSAHVIIFDMLWADFSARSGASPVIFSAHGIVFYMLWVDFSARSGASPVIFSAHVIIFSMLWQTF